MDTLIYYFTGTGNSLKISKDISAGIPGSRLRHIAAALAKGEADSRAQVQKIGIVFPVYVEGLPLIVERFVRGLVISEDMYIFAVANYGASAGRSLIQLENLLSKKGSRLSAAFGLKMPDNTQILFPPSPEEEQRHDFKREAAEAESIARIVRERSEAGLHLVRTGHSASSTPWNRPAFEPGKMARKFSADNTCNGCAVCAEVCPVDNIIMKDTKPQWQDRCEQCLACMQWCPEKAIQFGTRTSAWGRYHHPDIRITELLRRSLV